jgi:hypothetical protein
VNRAPPFDDLLMMLPSQALDLGAEVGAHSSSRIVDLPLTRRSDLCVCVEGGRRSAHRSGRLTPIEPPGRPIVANR